MVFILAKNSSILTKSWIRSGAIVGKSGDGNRPGHDEPTWYCRKEASSTWWRAADLAGQSLNTSFFLGTQHDPKPLSQALNSFRFSLCIQQHLPFAVGETSFKLLIQEHD